MPPETSPTSNDDGEKHRIQKKMESDYLLEYLDAHERMLARCREAHEWWLAAWPWANDSNLCGTVPVRRFYLPEPDR